MEIKKTKLVNGEKRNKQYPETFIIPDQESKKNLACGDYVSIGILTNTTNIDAEKLWVKVLHEKDTGYVGKLLQKPIVNQKYKIDDLLFFKARNILKIVKENEIK